MTTTIQERWDKLHRTFHQLIREYPNALNNEDLDYLQCLLDDAIRLEEYETAHIIKIKIDEKLKI